MEQSTAGPTGPAGGAVGQGEGQEPSAAAKAGLDVMLGVLNKWVAHT